MYDIIIIGGGPAGITAGIYTTRAGLKTLIFEKEAVGGQMTETPSVENYPGFSPISGTDLAEHFYKQAEDLGVEFAFERIIKIENGNVKKVITDDNKTYECRSIILATGSHYKSLELDNEDNLTGNGIHYCVSCDGPYYKNKIVAVVGGANTAVTNSLYLSGIAKKVYLIYRKDELRAEKSLIDRLLSKDNVEVIYNSNIITLNGKKSLESIVIDTKGKTKELVVDGLFEAVGMQAQTELIDGLLATNDTNYVISDDCTTSIPGLFVAGDCRDKEIRQITTATSDGTLAAIEAIKYMHK